MDKFKFPFYKYQSYRSHLNIPDGYEVVPTVFKVRNGTRGRGSVMFRSGFRDFAVAVRLGLG